MNNSKDTKYKQDMKFTQKVDKKKLKQIINNLDIIPDVGVYEDGFKYKYKDTQKKSVLTFLSNFYDTLDNEGKVSIQYYQKEKRGRVWNKKNQIGITNLCKSIRHTIASEFNIDIDMVNCHPILLWNYIKKYNLDNPDTPIQYDILNQYINNRDEILKELNGDEENKELFLANFSGSDDNTDGKTVILKIINGGKISPYFQSNQFVNDFFNEIKEIRDRLKNILPDLYQYVKRKKEKGYYNLDGSFLNHLMLDLEGEALKTIIKFFKTKKVKITSLAFDGLTIDKNETNLKKLPKLIEDCEKFVSEELNIEKFKLSVKEMNNIIDLPELTNEEKEEEKRIEEEEKRIEEEKVINNKKCECRIHHPDMFKIIFFISKKFKLNSINSIGFNDLMCFIVNYSDEKCVSLFVWRVVGKFSNNTEYELSEDFETDEKYNVNWVSELIGNNSNYNDIKAILTQHKETVDRPNTIQLTQDLQNSSFDKKYHIHNLISYFLTHIFNSYDEMMDYFYTNISHYAKKILFPDCFYINQGENGFTLSGVIKLDTRYYTAERVIEEIQFDGLIRKSVEVRSYIPMFSNITFRPDYKVGVGELNTYNGFKSKLVDRVNMDLIKPILHHIKTCWADDNEDVNDYILQWFRQAFLEPWNKTQIVLLLYGEEGVGKGLLLDNLIIPLIYGSDIACTSQGLTPITQRFNSICMDKCFIAVNEVSSSEDNWHVSFERLKAIITDPTFTIEKKGIDIFKDYPNYINFIFTTNNSDSVKMGKGDRRYCCLEVSNRYKGDYDYMEKLIESCNQEVADHFYTYICNLDKTRNIKRIPMTELRRDMLSNGLSSTDKFIEVIKEFDRTEFARNIGNDRLQYYYKEESWELHFFKHLQVNHIKASDFYHTYKLWCKENGERNIKTNTMFGKEMKRVFTFTHTRIGNVYTFEN